MAASKSNTLFIALLIGIITAVAVGGLGFAVIVHAEPVEAPHRSLAWVPLALAGVLTLVAILGAIAGAFWGRRDR